MLHVSFGQGTAEIYHDLCDTLLLPCGKIMSIGWTVDHERTIGPLARGDDAVHTSPPLDVPASQHIRQSPPFRPKGKGTHHRLRRRTGFVTRWQAILPDASGHVRIHHCRVLRPAAQTFQDNPSPKPI